MTAPRVIKLTYFNLTGRAEIARLALHIGGIEFEDERLSRAVVAERKAILPYGQLPVLTVDGRVFAQSSAIARYAGALSGLYPTDPLAALQVDEVLEHAKDIFDTLVPTLREPDAAKRIAMRQELAERKVAPMCAALERRVAATKVFPGDFLLGSSLTLADLELYLTMGLVKSGWFEGLPTTLCDNHATWGGIAQSVARHPKVQSWNNRGKL
ncbi:glutathione S-transferase [Achlya hypogyna]|uniref:Glutathione S-transferase n=1 Tax=Achlya hypogyna TaxID=1202772 RepID=A0A1V9ZC73_ACHHY|nr:glutathione S-transferase [Achlya hypogyna]